MSLETLRLPPELGVSESLGMVRRADLEDEDTLIVALNFTCNSRCRFCIIETEIDHRLDDVGPEVFDRLFKENARTGAFQRLTISGAEATLRKDLPDLARRARHHGKFSHVRIQTNARRTADPETARRLVDSGIDEYFVSIHGHTPELDARITQAPKSFHEMLRGVSNLLGLGARVISNTVMCADNAEHLPNIADFILGLGIGESHLWNFLELGDVRQGNQHVRITTLQPHLLETLRRFTSRQVAVTVKWFPRCLLGPYGHLLDNHQPQMLIRDEFQKRLSDAFTFGCPHASQCVHFRRTCDGLHDRYRGLYGDESDALRPTAG